MSNTQPSKQEVREEASPITRADFIGQAMKMSTKHFSDDGIDLEDLSQEDQDIMDAVIKSSMMFGIGSHPRQSGQAARGADRSNAGLIGEGMSASDVSKNIAMHAATTVAIKAMGVGLSPSVGLEAERHRPKSIMIDSPVMHLKIPTCDEKMIVPDMVDDGDTAFKRLHASHMMYPPMSHGRRGGMNMHRDIMLSSPHTLSDWEKKRNKKIKNKDNARRVACDLVEVDQRVGSFDIFSFTKALSKKYKG